MPRLASPAIDDGTYWGLSVGVPGEACSSTSDNLGNHRFYGASSGITTTGNALTCEEFTDPLNTRDWGILRQTADYYAIRVLANQ